jgi:hypothetical protein
MAFHWIYSAAVLRGVRGLGGKARRAPARVALLALVPAAGGLALAGGGAAPALAAGPAPSCSAGSCTVSFTTPGTGQSFIVPAGVTSLSVTLYGGAGGSTSFGGPTVAGGDGALLTATLTVSPGEVLGVDVGGAGTSSAGTAVAAVAGGVNGGGDGFDSGGGGGATDLTAAGTRLLVAGGGGGAGTAESGYVGVCAPGPGGSDPVPTTAAGGPGGNADNPGTDGESVSEDQVDMEGGHAGKPGTTAGPGAGGKYGFPDTPDGFGTCPGDGIGAGSTGGSGSGAAGGSGVEDPNYLPSPNNPLGDAGGGGGGGGYFGGGAGGSGASEFSGFTTTAGSGGGGGGASYTAGAGVSGASVSDTGNSGQVDSGNGEVVFTYADPVTTGSPAYSTNSGQALNVAAASGLLSAAAGTTQEAGLTASAATATTAQGGSVTVSANGSFGYTPAASFAGTDSFGYTVTDASGDTVSGTAVITVTAVSTSPKADIAVSLSCPSSLGAGKSGTCTLTVVNHGPSAASKLTAALTLPANVTEVSCTGGCSKSRGLLTWTATSLASGSSVSYQVTVKAAQPGKAILLGAAASRNPDPHLLNNIAIATITVKR